MYYNVTLWRFRVMSVPTRLTLQPDTISLGERAFWATLIPPETIKPV